MSKAIREKLLIDAQNVGLALGVDFQEKISNANLEKKIKEKQEEIEANLKGAEAIKEENPKTDIQNSTVEQNKPIENQDKEKQEEIEEVDTYEDEMQIRRISPCGNYRVPIKGIKECARRTNLTVDQIKEALETKKPINGWMFEEIE